MTIPELDAMELALEKRLQPWIAKANAAIVRHVDDANALAIKVLGDTLSATPDGRPSARMIVQSRSFGAGASRLRMLQDALIGPSRNSLDGLLRDARAAFYVDSVTLWTPHFPEEFRVTFEPQPTATGEALMRGAIVHGYDLFRELAPEIARAGDHLFAAANVAGRRHAGDGLGRDLFGVWKQQTIRRLMATVGSILTDSDKAVHEATGWLILKPQYRGERQFAGGGVHF